jgi:hypothetical protein
MAGEDLAFDPSAASSGDVSWGDYLKTLGAGTASIGSGLAAASRQAFEAGNSKAGADLSHVIQDAFGEVEGSITGSMGEEAKKRLSASITSADFWDHPVSSLALKGTNMTPMIAATLIPGGIFSDALAATAATAAAGGAINAGLVEKEIYEKTDKLSDKELQDQVPYYASLRTMYDETDARAKFNQKRMGMAPAINFVLGAAAGAVGPAASIVRGAKGAGAVLGAGENASLGRAAGLGAAEGGIGNAAQAGVGEYTAQNADVGPDTLNRPLEPGKILDASLEGTALGGIMGAVGGGVGHALKRGERTDSPAAEAPFTNKGMKITDPAAPDANPAPVPTIEDHVMGVQPTPQAKTGATGTPAKPVDNPAVVGNPQNAPTRGKRAGGKKKVVAEGNAVVEQTGELAPNADQALAMAANDAGEAKGPPPEPTPQVPEQPVAAPQAAPEPAAAPVAQTPEPVRAPVEVGPEATPEPAREPNSVPPAAAEDFAAFGPVAEAPATPPRTGRVLPNLSEEAKANVKAQNAAIRRNIGESEPVTPKGKNLTKAQKGQIETTKQAAEKIYNDHPPGDAEGAYSTAVPDRDAVVARAKSMVAAAEEQGIKIPQRVKLSTTGSAAVDSPHVQMLVYARDLAKVAKTHAKGKKLTDAVIRFKEREDAVRSGNAAEAVSARKAEGEAARRQDQGDVEQKSTAQAFDREDASTLSPEEALIRREEEEGRGAEEAPAPVRRAEPPKPKPVSDRIKDIMAQAEERRKAQPKTDEATAGAVRKVMATPEEKAAILKRFEENQKREATRRDALDAAERESGRTDIRFREGERKGLAGIERNPTIKQREAGNYRKGHIKVDGLDITIETPRGAIRRAVDGSWEAKQPDHYGYIKRTTGADGEHIDTYVGKDVNSKKVFVIDQLDHRTGEFDEHKVMLRYDNEIDAANAYQKSFSDGNGLKRLGNMHEMSIAEFNDWLKSSHTQDPITASAYGLTPEDLGVIEPWSGKGREVVSDYGAPEDAGEVLSNLDISRLPNQDFQRGPTAAVMPYILRRLARVVKGTPVHFVTESELRMITGVNPKGILYGIHQQGPDGRSRILVNKEHVNETATTLIHEATHDAMIKELNANPRMQENIKDMMFEAHEHLTDLYGADFPTHFDNMFKNEHEFIAEAWSNPKVQELLASIEASDGLVSNMGLKNQRGTMWDVLKHVVRTVMEKVLGPLPNSESLFDAAMRAGEHILDMRERREAFSDHKMAARNLSPYPREQMTTFARSAGDIVNDYLKRPESHTMENAPRMLKLRTFDNIAQMADHFWGENNPVRRVYEAAQKIQVSSQRYIQKAEGAVRSLYDAKTNAKPEQFTELADLLHDATIANVHPDVALTDAKNAHIGKNKLSAVQAKYRHADLAKRYNALPAPLKKAYHDAINFFTKQQNDLAFETLKNRMRELGHDDEALARRVFADTLTDPDRARLGDALPLLEATKELSQIHGPYVPLMRRGDHVVIGEYHVSPPDPASGAKRISQNEYEFKSRKAAEDYAAKHDLKATVRSVWVDSATGDLYHKGSDGKDYKVTSKDINSENRFRVELQDKHVEFFEGKKAAERAAAELKKQGITIRTVEPRKPDQVGLPQFMPGQVQSLMAALKKRQSYKDATPTIKREMERSIQEAGIQMLGSTRIQSKHLPRRHVEGASRDIVQNMFDYAVSTSRSLAKLEHMPELEQGLKDIDNTVEQDSSKLKNYARRAISNEVHSRIRQGDAFNEKDSLSPVTKRLLAVSFLDKLGSPAYSVINAMQPAMVTMPYLAGRHGVGRTFAALSKAYSDINAGSILKQGVIESVKKLKGGHQADDFITTARNRLSHDEQRMVDEQMAIGNIDPSAGLEIAALLKDRSGIGGKLDTGIGYLEGIAREMPRAVEAVNRLVTATATYRLERARGATHEAASRAAGDAVANTQFNYSAANAPAGFNHPLAKLALQFKKFGQGMYQLIGSQIGQALRNESPQKRAEAIKTLIGIAATHTAMAGALGLPTEPFKYLVMATSPVTGVQWGDVENKIRTAAAELLGKTGGEVATRGLPRLLNLDLSRMGLDSVTSFGEPQTMKENDVEAWLFKSISGPVASLLGDWVKGASAFANGDLVKGAELTVPMKGAADAIRAYRQASEGKKSASGRQTLSPYTPTETALRALGFGNAREAETNEARSAYYSASNAQKEERAALISKAATATGAARAKAMVAISRFNQHVPAAVKIKPGDITRKQKSNSATGMVLGVKPSRQDRHLLQGVRDVYDTE